MATPIIQDRIKELRRVKASELLRNPSQWKIHPNSQSTALRGALEEIGFADALIGYETDDGITLIDGHLRAQTAPDMEVPILITDLNEEEANKVLATLDPLAMLATNDSEVLQGLVDSVDIQSEDLRNMVRRMGANTQISHVIESSSTLSQTFNPPTQEVIDEIQAELETKFEQLTTNAISTLVDVTCPSCGETFQVSRTDLIAQERRGQTFSQPPPKPDPIKPLSDVKDRIKELRRIKASDLLENPNNWRVHPVSQSMALRDALNEIGFADALIGYETDEGVMLIDGHLRARTAPDMEVPVLITDLNEDEANKLLATLDPLAMLAQTNSNVLQRLVESFDLQSGELLDMVDENMRKGYQVEEEDNAVPAPTEQEIERAKNRAENKSGWGSALTESIVAGLVNMICPNCGEEFQMNRSELMV
jgi:predicted RNA-binding Zn-ribbon protein involved in translation (DUF1610 family)